MNRLYASLYPQSKYFTLRQIGSYAKANDPYTIIGINRQYYNDINDLEIELQNLKIVIAKLEFLGNFIEYSIVLKFDEYRNLDFF